jgi:hypothetical protein
VTNGFLSSGGASGSVPLFETDTLATDVLAVEGASDIRRVDGPELTGGTPIAVSSARARVPVASCGAGPSSVTPVADDGDDGDGDGARGASGADDGLVPVPPGRGTVGDPGCRVGRAPPSPLAIFAGEGPRPSDVTAAPIRKMK